MFLMLYAMIWLLSLSFSSWLFIWLSMELLNWTLMFYITSMLTFILWQSISSLILLFMWVIYSYKWFFMAALLMKTGMPPMILWVPQVQWKWLSWIIFMTWQKSVPFIILILIIFNSILILIWPLVSLTLLIYSNEWFMFMWSSTLSDSAWLCLSNTWKSFWMFFSIYSIIWTLWSGMKLSYSFKLENSLMLMFFFLILGIPPSIFFLIKILIWINMPFMKGIILSLLSWMMLFLYWKWLTLTLSQTSFLKSFHNMWAWMNGLLLLHVIVAL